MSILAQPISGQSWKSTFSARRGELTIIYFPQAGLITQENGKMSGLCVSILNDFKTHVKSKYQVDLRINYLKEEKVFSGLLADVASSNNIVGVSNVSITEERKKKYKFSPAFLQNPFVLITSKDAPSLDNFEQIQKIFKGFTAEALDVSHHLELLQSIKSTYFPSLKITTSTTNEELVKHIVEKKTVFTITDFCIYLNLLRDRLPIKHHDVSLNEKDELGFIMSKNCDWKDPLDEFLNGPYKQSSDYKSHIVKNLGQSYFQLIKSNASPRK